MVLLLMNRSFLRAAGRSGTRLIMRSAGKTKKRHTHTHTHTHTHRYMFKHTSTCRHKCPQTFAEIHVPRPPFRSRRSFLWFLLTAPFPSFLFLLLHRRPSLSLSLSVLVCHSRLPSSPGDVDTHTHTHVLVGLLTLVDLVPQSPWNGHSGASCKFVFLFVCDWHGPALLPLQHDGKKGFEEDTGPPVSFFLSFFMFERAQFFNHIMYQRQLFHA